MPRIIIQDFAFYGYHGVYAHEAIEGTKFRVQCIVDIEEGKEFESDAIEDALNYEKLIDAIKDVGENHRYQLVERLCAVMLDRILAYERVLRAEITIYKWLHYGSSEGQWLGVQLTRSKT